MIPEQIKKITASLPKNTTLIAVSKTKPLTDILKAYNAGHRDFGENKIQEMLQKWEQAPKDIRWHMIGHVQRNKVKYMAPFVHLIHAVDSLKLLKEINKQAQKNNRTINCLLQVFIAQEDTKFGFIPQEISQLLENQEYQSLTNIRVQGLMGMATLTQDKKQLENEFLFLKTFFDSLKEKYGFSILSMGMSSDYSIALACGSNMVRIGSAIFGTRTKSKQ